MSMPRDRLGDLLGDAAADGRLRGTWATLGFRLTELGPARPSEIVASGSSWARRLGVPAGAGRRVLRLRLVRLP